MDNVVPVEEIGNCCINISVRILFQVDWEVKHKLVSTIGTVVAEVFVIAL
jgi:hypothetical protein